MVLYNNTPFQKALNITLFSYNTSLSSVSLGNFPSFLSVSCLFQSPVYQAANEIHSDKLSCQDRVVQILLNLYFTGDFESLLCYNEAVAVTRHILHKNIIARSVLI